MKTFVPIDRLRVLYRRSSAEALLVGELAYRDRRAFFQYDSAFLKQQLQLSPFHLPAQAGLQSAKPGVFEGLFGLFDDSLPDGWGRLLQDRYVQSQGVRAASLTPLDRLAFVGGRGMGALSYEPVHEIEFVDDVLDLHKLAKEAQLVLEDETSEALAKLLKVGGSPQGARPKALIQLSSDSKVVRSFERPEPGFVPYLVKYPARSDSKLYAGAIEYAYSLMAKAAGIEMPQTQLLAKRGKNLGYFAIERFDCEGDDRVHVHTASGLLHAPPGNSFLTYEQLHRLCWTLTKDIRCVKALFARAVFNVMAHNRDDHARNFAFVMDANGTWSLSPAYDLMFSEGPGGHHTMTVAGEGNVPRMEHFEKLGKMASLGPEDIAEVVEAVSTAVKKWPKWAEQAGLPRKEAQKIAKRHQQL